VDVKQDAPLFAQNITQATCNKRQEKGYHKCSRCVHHELERVKRELMAMPMW
jgi:hypothetical protein